MRYSATDQEALAVVFSMQKFHHLLRGSKSQIVTDHRSLLTVFTCKTKSPRMSGPIFQIVRHVSSREDIKLLESFNAVEMRKEQMKES